MAQKHLSERYNAPETLKEILDKYYPEYYTANAIKSERIMRSIYLAREPSSSSSIDFTCKRCGGKQFVIHSPRISKFQCVTCRDYVFPKAGSVEEFTSVSLAAIVPKLGQPAVLTCLADTCKNWYNNSCKQPAMVLDSDGQCVMYKELKN